LIKQRLEGVVISAVDDSDSDGMVKELEGGVKTSEAAADDHDMRRGFIVHLSPSSKVVVIKIS
jgi:hypothetical protein